MRLDSFLLTEGINDKGIFKAVFMAGHPGSGKAQPLYSKIRTPSGWTTMGNIKIGDEIITPNNTISKVIDIHPQGIKDIYRIYLFDGRYVDCTEDHLWKIYGFYKKINGKSKRQFTLRTLKEIKEKMDLPTYKDRLFLPIPCEIEYPKQEMIIDPYTMGVLLGDGCLKQRISFSTNDIEIVEIINQSIDDYHITSYNDKDFFICPNKKGIKSKYRQELEKLGLWELYSYEKFIPEKYKTSSIEDRYELIKGLMDTDGYVSKKGYIQFYTTSRKLMNDIREVIWSLGGNTLVREKMPFYKDISGNKIECRKCFSITILHNNSKNLFKLERKKERCKELLTHKKRLFMKIKSIEYIGKHEAKCISIDDENGLYLTDNYVITHNSYTLKKIKSGSIEPRIVNTDKLFFIFKDWWEDKDMWAEIRDDVKEISQNQLALYINGMLPLAIDGTAGDPSIILRRRGLIESFGYDTGMVFVNTDLETALKRAAKRDRKVDPDFIRQSYEKIRSLKSFYRSRFTDWIEVDNNEGSLNNEVIAKAFKHMDKFYRAPVQNPIGQMYIKELKENGAKTLAPTIMSIEEIKQTLSVWYRR